MKLKDFRIKIKRRFIVKEVKSEKNIFENKKIHQTRRGNCESLLGIVCFHRLGVYR
jgi:hypothetical protein